MKTMKFKTNLMKHLLGMLFISILFIGCSPEDGKNGTNGVDGIDGTDGQTGTANVIYSDWIPNNFTLGGGLLQKVFTLASTDEINSFNVNLDTSTVMVYGRGDILLTAGDEVFPLPYITGGGARYTFTINDGRIRAVGQTSNVADNDFDVFDDYRYVIIPGGISTSARSTNATSSIDYSEMSYEEIIAHFNIPD